MKTANAAPSHLASILGPDGRRLDVSVDRGDDEGAGTVTLAMFVVADDEAICRCQWAGTLLLDEFFGAFGLIRDHLKRRDFPPDFER